jgi:hypothetical protein
MGHPGQLADLSPQAVDVLAGDLFSRRRSSALAG